MAKPPLATSTIVEALAPRFGRIELAAITEGEESQAFGLHHTDGEFIVRVNRSDTGFRKDAWAHSTLGDHLPIPEVIHIGRIDDDHHYCVSTRLPGDIVQDTTDDRQLTELAPVMTEALELVNSVNPSHLNGYGDFDPATAATGHRRWRDVVLDLAATDLDHPNTPPDIASSEVERLRDVVTTLAADLPEEPRLVHGDFGANNPLVRDGRVTGVLDWGAAMVGDPLYDLANTRLWAPFLPCMRAHADHAEARLTEPDAPHRIRCYLLAIGLRATDYYLAAGQPHLASALFARIAGE
ncbi:hygromycin-B 4-O-kinase [Stackebrandtia endophytica]|uniref:Hygromycin-B 4-O-kinase n=1 Tax=Stackebrandtia endophytica TaxID=1496996 RepID=A0A543ATK6_9ACTN|nr:aminoglycoside phosphotransferase family protein [Stackebrandtia endophytica]TQL75914.1 hygromycin-B 4-O-kinase [Stackebrandtia endophytica]